MTKKQKHTSGFDPVTLEIYRALYTSVAEEMGIALRRTAHSPNIKERRDYSCAVFDRAGRVIAQGDHMPVHLGSMPMAVRAALDATSLAPGDVVMLNDPFAGGTHLPDVTLIAAVFSRQPSVVSKRKTGNRKQKAVGGKPSSSAHRSLLTAHTPLFYVVNRAHHADVGGATPGSMGVAESIYGEGVRIPPVHLVRAGDVNRDLLRLLLANVRAPAERASDFEAQLGSLQVGERRLREIIERASVREAEEYAAHLIGYSARLMKRAIKEIPDGLYEAADALDNDGVTGKEVRLQVRVRIKGEWAVVDFTGSAQQVRGPINAVEAITVAAVSYVFRCLIEVADVPASAGLMNPITVVAPPGTIVNARMPAAVAGGNVEMSQRIVDVLFKALAEALPERIPAASQGTMNNLTIGGFDPRVAAEFAYYETIAGGMGARPGANGLSAVHTHMTNSLNTPIEALEYAYPLRVRRYEVRRGSGGCGQRQGGDGVVREVETLVPARVSLLADRRERAPYGLHGGSDGQPGYDSIIRQNSAAEPIASKGTWELAGGDRVRIETPGGGGFGIRN